MAVTTQVIAQSPNMVKYEVTDDGGGGSDTRTFANLTQADTTEGPLRTFFSRGTGLADQAAARAYLDNTRATRITVAPRSGSPVAVDAAVDGSNQLNLVLTGPGGGGESVSIVTIEQRHTVIR